jgi:hypothetical protein
VRRERETFPELQQRLDVAIGKALHEGVVTNEVNGGRFRLAPSSVRKNRQPAEQISGAPRHNIAWADWPHRAGGKQRERRHRAHVVFTGRQAVDKLYTSMGASC